VINRTPWQQHLNALPVNRPANTDAAILALCLWREARGESSRGRGGVACVIRNRMTDSRKRWPQTAAGVVLQPLQFSSFNSGDPNSTRYPSATDRAWMDCTQIAEQVLSATPPEDPSGHANHYYDISIQAPYWAQPATETARIGRLVFHRL